MMEKNYDAIVVGAGNGGLMAAIALQAKGKKVLLIEKHNLPGGVATSFVRGRFEFDASLHEMCAVGSEENPGHIRDIFKQYGINVEFCKVPDLFRVIGTYSDGEKMDVVIPDTKEGLKKAMLKIVPDSEESIDKMFDIFNSFKIVSEKGNGLFKAVLKSVKYAALPTIEVFKKIKMPQKAIDILSTYWSYLGVPLEELIFAHFYAMVSTYIDYGAYIFKHTSNDLATTMLERFRELGGTILLGTTCEKILTSKKKVTGVIANGTIYNSDNVIFNGNPTTAYKYLLDCKISSHEKRLINTRQFSSRPFVVYLGLNKSIDELGIHDYSIFIPNCKNAFEEYETMKSIKENKYLISVCPAICSKECVKENTTGLILTSIYSSNCWNDVKEEDYYKTKEDKAQEMIKTFEEKTGIKISDSIEEISIATPWTYYRYVNTPQGAGYGYELKSWDNIIARFLHKKKDCSIKGLHFCGGSSVIGNGYNVAMLSGLLSANTAEKKMKGNK